jgi:hypothetical protein
VAVTLPVSARIFRKRSRRTLLNIGILKIGMFLASRRSRQERPVIGLAPRRTKRMPERLGELRLIHSRANQLQRDWKITRHSKSIVRLKA